jgi:hypothetical protein
MMRKRVDVPLKHPFPGHGGQVNKIVLQEPSGADFFALGEPKGWVRTGSGHALVENDQVIRAYVERCIVEPDPLLVMSQIHFLDARAVKEAVCGFFQEEAPST